MNDSALKSGKISIIIPVYKVEPYLRQCLESIINQTYRNLEIIIIDDGSPDNCGAICDEYAQKDERIIVIHKENGGVNTARNLGIQKATGEWIAFVDSDDWCAPDYYERLINAVGHSKPDIFMAGGYIKAYAQKRKVIRNFKNDFWIDKKEEIKYFMANILAYGLPWDKIFRTEFLVTNHLTFDTSIKAFDDIWSNFLFFSAANRVGGCTALGYYYRQIAISMSRGFNPEKPKQCYTYISKLYDYIMCQGLEEQAMQAVDTSAIAAILSSFDGYFFHPANKKSSHEIADEIRNMKNCPHIHRAIWTANNAFYTRTQIIWKYMLRLPWIWPLRALYRFKEELKKIIGRNSGQ